MVRRRSRKPKITGSNPVRASRVPATPWLPQRGRQEEWEGLIFRAVRRRGQFPRAGEHGTFLAPRGFQDEGNLFLVQPQGGPQSLPFCPRVSGSTRCPLLGVLRPPTPAHFQTSGSRCKSHAGKWTGDRLYLHPIATPSLWIHAAASLPRGRRNRPPFQAASPQGARELSRAPPDRGSFPEQRRSEAARPASPRPHPRQAGAAPRPRGAVRAEQG